MVNSLGLDKAVKDTKVLVAMSGGVDSSVVAAMLKEQGYDIIGVTLQLYNHGEAIQKKNACCAGRDINDAKMVAAKLDFPHYVLDYEDIFKEQVIDDFADTYVKGYTPIPCVRCNQTVKFKDLFAIAKDLKADCMVTGHYIRREEINGVASLLRGVDNKKDQSYFLFATTQEQIEYLRFPLGGLNKDETRKLAKKYDLIVSDKPDSQDICFVPNGGYQNLVQKLRPEAIKPGNIVHKNGEILGTHNGIISYTIGQRRGLNIGGRKNDTSPLYVIELNKDTREVIVGSYQDLAIDKIIIDEVNWLPQQGVNNNEIPVSLKIRSTMDIIDGYIYLNSDNEVEIQFKEPVFGVSLGQACVFYDNQILLGGGFIAKTIRDN